MRDAPSWIIKPPHPIRTGLTWFLDWRYHNKYTFNFIAIIIFLVLLPLFADNSVAQVFIDILIIIVLFFAVHAISENPVRLVIGMILAGIAIILDSLFYLTGKDTYYHISILIALLFFGFVSVIIFFGIIRERDITRDTIFGALSVYFLLGITWAFGIMAMETAYPRSFGIVGSGSVQLSQLPDFIGYSFSVLTTTGNYSISALTSTARMVMMFEMAIGTLYIAVLISWMVGRFLVREK